MRKLSQVRPLVLAGLVLMGCSSDAKDPNPVVAEAALTASGVDVSLALTSDWGSGYCTSVTLKNNSSSAVANWSVTVQLNQSTLSQIWSATSTVSGTQMTATAMSYNQTIATGASASFGFCGAATGTNYKPTLVSANVSGGGPSSGTGGASSTGGMKSTGGANATGGARPTGGANATGGARPTGGATATGGTKATGGANATGGSKATGGLPATGGANATGGTTSSGNGRKFVGNIDTAGSIRSDFATYWNQFSPENAGKWGSVQPSSQSSFNWASLDAMYSYCTAHNIIFKQHNFVWGAQQPGWTSSLTASNGPAAVQNWMKAFCTRYPNTKYIDVVNEPPPHTTPAYINAIGGTGSSGYDWIVNAFKWARAACPNATLILNDYNTIEYSADHNNIINIANKIKAAGAPIDALGAQAHAVASFSASAVQSSIDDLATKTGLPVYITEFDINVADDNQQASIMQSLFTMFWNDSNVKGITLWGYVQGATWQANTGLITSSGTMRPAMTWLTNFLKTH